MLKLEVFVPKESITAGVNEVGVQLVDVDVTNMDMAIREMLASLLDDSNTSRTFMSRAVMLDTDQYLTVASPCEEAVVASLRNLKERLEAQRRHIKAFVDGTSKDPVRNLLPSKLFKDDALLESYRVAVYDASASQLTDKELLDSVRDKKMDEIPTGSKTRERIASLRAAEATLAEVAKAIKNRTVEAMVHRFFPDQLANYRNGRLSRAQPILTFEEELEDQIKIHHSDRMRTAAEYGADNVKFDFSYWDDVPGRTVEELKNAVTTLPAWALRQWDTAKPSVDAAYEWALRTLRAELGIIHPGHPEIDMTKADIEYVPCRFLLESGKPDSVGFVVHYSRNLGGVVIPTLIELRPRE